jgi:hypothetical protein
MILNARYAFDYSRLSASNEVGELVSLYRRNTISQLPYLLSAVTLLVVAAPTIFVFSRIDSVDANLLLAVLVAGTLVSAACGPIVTASLATGNAHTVSATMAFTVGVSTLMVFLLKDQMHGLLLAQIVAGTVISQNLIMYFLWMRRQNRLLGKLKNA